MNEAKNRRPTAARILMAEDNPADVTVTRAAFDEIGLDADVEVITDGAGAIARLLDPTFRPPDLIILNFNLPKVQGHEVLSAIKKTDRLLGVPVVMFTSSNRQRDQLICQTADAYFVKSGGWETLLSIVRHLRDLITALPSMRPTTQHRLEEDGFWRQGDSGPQGSGERPIADIKLTDATERKYVGEKLDEKGDKEK